MRLPQVRFKLWHIMVAVAVVAGLIAALEMPAVAAVVIPTLVVFLPTLLAPPARRLGIAAWASSFYPLIVLSSLYTTWFTAWLVLGHRPRSSIDDPKFISLIVDVPHIATWMLIFGVPAALFLCAFLVIADAVRAASRGEARPIRIAAQMLTPLFVWLSFIAIWQWDLLGDGDVRVWFFD